MENGEIKNFKNRRRLNLNSLDWIMFDTKKRDIINQIRNLFKRNLMFDHDINIRCMYLNDSNIRTIIEITRSDKTNKLILSLGGGEYIGITKKNKIVITWNVFNEQYRLLHNIISGNTNLSVP